MDDTRLHMPDPPPPADVARAKRMFETLRKQVRLTQGEGVVPIWWLHFPSGRIAIITTFSREDGMMEFKLGYDEPREVVLMAPESVVISLDRSPPEPGDPPRRRPGFASADISGGEDAAI